MRATALIAVLLALGAGAVGHATADDGNAGRALLATARAEGERAGLRAGRREGGEAGYDAGFATGRRAAFARARRASYASAYRREFTRRGLPPPAVAPRGRSPRGSSSP